MSYIKRQDAIDVVGQLYRYESDRMTALQELPTIDLEDKIEMMKKMQQNTIDDEYDTGFFNGIEYCLGLLEGREENYRKFNKK